MSNVNYAETLLAHFARLSHATNRTQLLSTFVQSLATLCRCELVQTYLLDSDHRCLSLHAEYLDGFADVRPTASSPADASAEQLLRFVLSRKRVLYLENLSCTVHDLGFLPSCLPSWQSLLCLPLVNQAGDAQGVLLYASQQQKDLKGYAESFGVIGSFLLGQLRLMRRLFAQDDEVTSQPVVTADARSHGLIGSSTAMRQVYGLVSKILHSPCTVLLRGETGTGKELVAQAIHEGGPRRSAAFVVQNCAALPDNLLESEFFGYRKGAFTGADRDRKGLFDAANGGTLLLDEVGDMPLSLQAKLLRVLQEGEIRPLGCNDTHKVDVRIIAATHRDLFALVASGAFREDLYYRLTQFPIELPALREREEDILILAKHFAIKACADFQRDAVNWSQGALDTLSNYAFPGNVRELKCLVERALLLCEGNELLAEHFPLHMNTAVQSSGGSLRERLDQVERGLMLDCLRKNNGNQTVAARELGLPRRTFLYRMGRLNIPVGKGAAQI